MMGELNNCYTSSPIPPVFIYQNNMNEYYAKCEVFTKALELYLSNKFKLQVN